MAPSIVMRRVSAILVIALLMVFAPVTRGQLAVWVNFDATWESELGDLAIIAGIDPFSAGEVTTLETGILGELDRIYGDYDVTFVTGADPGGARNVINFGATTATPGLLGQAPLLPFMALLHSDLGPTTAASVYAQNFAFIVDEFTGSGSRSTQITQLTNALAGTGAHELLHSLGVRHEYAYGNDGITSDNYTNTLGLQNTAIIATGSTGLDEPGRESQRELGQWERAHLDFSGGSVFGGTSVVTSPVSTLNESGDLGNTFATATNINPFLTTGETSGLELALIYGDFDSTTDIDTLSITLASAGLLTLDFISTTLFAAPIDPLLVLLDSDGVTPLFTSADTLYSGNVYGAGTLSSNDVFLPNLSLNAGTYYISLRAEGAETVGDDYQLAIGLQLLAVPEPAAMLIFATGLVMMKPSRKRA